NIRIQEPNTFLCAENAMDAQAREGVCHGKEFHRRPESYNINCFSFVLEFCHPNYRIGAPTCANHTVPYGTALLGGAFPGTSCQATIAPSLRDISQQALARCCCEMSASASRRDNTDRSLARSAWESVPRKNRPVGYGMIGRSYSQRY